MISKICFQYLIPTTKNFQNEVELLMLTNLAQI